MTKPQHEQDYETLVKVLGANAALEPPVRIHREAAKVPALEARNEEAKAEHLLLDLAGIAPVVSNISERVRLLLESFDRVAFERDAARQEVTDTRIQRDSAYKSCTAWETEVTALRERVDAAEARVKELGAKGRSLHDAASMALNLIEYGERRNELSIALSTNYSPPTPSALVDVVGHAEAEQCACPRPCETCRREHEAHTKERAASASQPAPAPAQGATVDTVREALEACPCDASEPCEKCCALLDTLDALTIPVAPPTPTPPALVEAVGTYVETARAALQRDMGMPSVAVQATREEWMSLVAAYDAAKGGEVVDKARVVEVLRDLREMHVGALCRAEERRDERLIYDHRAMLDALQQVATRLGLTLDTPPSGPGGGERRDCGCGSPHCETGLRNAQRNVPPSPPAAPESSTPWDAPLPPQPIHVIKADGTFESPLPRRPRQPVPEVPALKAECGNGVHCWASGAVACACGLMSSQPPMPNGGWTWQVPVDFGPSLKDVMPARAAPGVVWSGKVFDNTDTRIMSDNRVWVLIQGQWLEEDDGPFIAEAFARALAEAKRELAGSVNPIALAAVRKTSFEEGAESMRERAAAQALILAHSHVDPNVRDACARLALEIAALSLVAL